ncbi:MAG: hypothetical protein HYZ54_11670 [Ignavibacteriae bacterium]|nr:hypothetical protein [Ignavibacteriota bacterium]
MKKQIVFFFSALALLIGCSDDPSIPPVTVDHPPATTVILTLVHIDNLGNPLDTTSCTVRDTSVTALKGKPSVEGKLLLKYQNIYKGTFTLLDESQSPTKDVTGEVVAEKEAHLFKLTVKENGNPSAAVVISDLDKDSKGLDFGLNFKVMTGANLANGAIHVILEHHDDGNKLGAQYDTDLDRDFPFELQ